jgi:hypothetical protein
MYECCMTFRLGVGAEHLGVSKKTVLRRFEQAGWSLSAFVADANTRTA